MIGLLFLFAACQEKVTSPAKVDTLPSIFPDYVGVTIPSTIAPLNFRVTDDGVEAVDVVIAGTKGKPVRLNGRSVDIPAKQWHELLESNKGDSIEVKVSVRQGKKWKEYRPFPIYVSPFPIDYGLVYRLLAPGYEVYSKMGIYERELSTFRQTPLFENTQVTAACIYLMFTLSDYGNFSIWHKEADLWLLDLRSGAFRNLEEVNSDDTESYHNWSSNSHWFVFSSRRGDGLYTRLYIASVDEQGRIGKPFLLPQQDPYIFYDQLIYSYNVPEFVSAPVQWDKREMAKGLMSKERVKVK